MITHTGGSFKMFTSEKPDSLRGPTLDTVWCEEFATLKTMVGQDGLTAFDNARLTLRAIVPGLIPRMVAATTPKRTRAVKTMLLDSQDPAKKIYVTRGSLTDNISNLAASFTEGILERFGSSPLGAQEIDGEMIVDVEGATFKSRVLDASRIIDKTELPELTRPILAIDPSVGDGSRDEVGLVVAAASAGTIPTEMKHGNLSVTRNVRHVYILDDRSGGHDPDAWANLAVQICEEYDIREVVAEGNAGRQMIVSLLRSRNPSLRVKLVNARVGKEARAEPVAGLFSQGRAHLVGSFPEMEDQMTTYVKGQSGQSSPDRMDACVYAVLHFEPSIGKRDTPGYTSPSQFSKNLG